MSKEKEARNARRAVRETMKQMEPIKLVPSKKGLLTIYLFCAAVGFVTGLLLHMVKP